MVVALGPGKFYGNSLPRPRIYTDVKLNDERVDPPVPVLDPLMSWAQEAHWSMGGLGFKRLRLQGRIEGSIKRLRAEREKLLKKKSQYADSPSAFGGRSGGDSAKRKSVSPSPPPAPIANKRLWRFMAVIDEDGEDEEIDQELESAEKASSEDSGFVPRRRPARKLGDDFDRVASESGLGSGKRSPVKNPASDLSAVAMRTRNWRSEIEDDGGAKMEVSGDVQKSISKRKKLNGGKKSERVTRNSPLSPASRTRTSPRLAKQG